MADLTHTRFYQDLRAPFSQALEIVQVATDPTVEHRGDNFPPVLTAAEFAGHIATKSDTAAYETLSPQERAREQTETTRIINKQLLTWTGEEFFEQVPIPITLDEDVPVSEIGFRITERGMRVADAPLRDQGAALLSRADAIGRHLDQAFARAHTAAPLL